MLIALYTLVGLVLAYLLLSLVLAYLVQEFPRKSYCEFALKLKSCFPPERSELFVAEYARHSESSLDPGYASAVQGFIDRHLDHAGDEKSRSNKSGR